MEQLNENATFVSQNDYELNNQQIQTGNIQSDNSVKYAGFWIRFCACFIDQAMVSLVMAFVAILLVNTLGLKAFSIMYVSVLILAVSYFVVSTFLFQATLGKKIVGIMVVREDFQKASFGKILFRETIGKIVSNMIFSIGFIMAAFTDKKRALHDMIAGTVVVYKNPSKKSNTILIMALVFGLLILMMLVGYMMSIQLASFKGGKVTNVTNSESKNDIKTNSTQATVVTSTSKIKPIEDVKDVAPKVDQNIGSVQTSVSPVSVTMESADIPTPQQTNDVAAEFNIRNIASNLNEIFRSSSSYKNFKIESVSTMPIQSEICTTSTRVDVAPDGKSYVVHRPLCSNSSKSFCIENDMKDIVTVDTINVTKTYHCK